MLTILAFIAGIFMGLHFNFIVLLPFSVLGAGAFLCSPWASGQSIVDSFVLLLIPIIFVQIGYMTGLMARQTRAQLLGRMNIGHSKRI